MRDDISMIPRRSATRPRSNNATDPAGQTDRKTVVDMKKCHDNDSCQPSGLERNGNDKVLRTAALQLEKRRLQKTAEAETQKSKRSRTAVGMMANK